MNISDIRAEQLKLLKILEAFDDFCKKHSIRYFLYAGTALGAVREKGFIAWDGDIDLTMSYPEYLKLDKAAKEEGGINGYAWVTYETDKHIPTLFAKVFEPGVNGDNLEKYSYIEICPYTGAPRQKWLQSIVWKTSLLNYDAYWVKNRRYARSLERKHSKIGMLAKILLFWWPSSLSLKIFKYYCAKWPFEESDEAIYLTGLYGIKRLGLKSELFSEEPGYKEFEGRLYPVFKDYDGFLKRVYGDYMTPVQYKRFE